VTVGVRGAYPALHLCFACEAEGEPRAVEGETAEPTWFTIAAVAGMLSDPSQFTGPTLAILRSAVIR
jgi:hypothetical protein